MTADGDVFSGTALKCHPSGFSGDAKSHGGAFLRVCVEVWAGKSHVWCWLGAYDQSTEEVAAQQRRWDAHRVASKDVHPKGIGKLPDDPQYGVLDLLDHLGMNHLRGARRNPRSRAKIVATASTLSTASAT